MSTDVDDITGIFEGTGEEDREEYGGPDDETTYGDPYGATPRRGATPAPRLTLRHDVWLSSQSVFTVVFSVGANSPNDTHLLADAMFLWPKITVKKYLV